MGKVDTDAILQFHFVFDEIGCISGYADVFEAIENEILLCFEHLGERFKFGGEHEEQIKKALMKFARSDRKKIGISKILPRFTAQKITADLINAKFLITEKSSEQRAQKERKNDRAGDLPGGYKQRLAMAAALLHEPPLLFLDEPTSGIDPRARRLFWQKIDALSKRGTTVIITTHFMEEAEYCTRILIQDHGTMLVLGSPAEIRARMKMPAADMNDVFIRIVEEARRREEETI